MSKAITFPETQRIDAGGKAHQRSPLLNGLFCTLIVSAALLASYPVAEIGFIDDWSYIKTALDFARTGHFLYNGGTSAMLGWQVVWGSLFIKLFGFSFTVVHLSTWPVALASILLFHQILVRFGITARHAIFGTLALGLSPVFVPLASSFMSDVPGLFVVLLCIYMCQRAIAASSDRAALLWLCSAALADVAGGTARQIAWLGALVMAPSTAWLLRNRRGMLPAGILIWAASVIGVFGCLHWFDLQPYSVSETDVVGAPIHPAMYLHLIVLLLKTLLCLLLLLLPVLAAWLPAMRKLSLKAYIRIATVVLAIAACYVFLNFRGRLGDFIAPWLSHVMMQLGMAPTSPEGMLGTAPATLAIPVRIAISLVVIVAGLVFAEQTFAMSTGEKTAADTSSLEHKQSSWRELGWLLGPFALSYLVLLLPRAMQGFTFDRYLLPLLPVAIIVLLRLYELRFAVELPALSWLVLAVFALYTVAASHDLFSLYRARVLAANEIRASGIPRTAIDGGFEYDGWTQIEDGGHLNSPFIQVPAGAYDPNVKSFPLAPACQKVATRQMPAVKPKYFLTLQRMDCLSPSNFPAAEYHAWLPPFHRKVFVQQLPEKSK